MVRQIPLVPVRDFTQQCELSGTTYTFRFRWSPRGQCWHMDLRTLDGVPIVLSMRLVSTWPLLRRVVGPLRPPGELFVIDQSGRDEDPNELELGARFGLFYDDLADLPEAP